MSASYFLDSNIFIYSFDESSPDKAHRAVKLIREAHESQKGVISFQVVQEFFSFALRRSVPPMSNRDAGDYLQKIFLPLTTIHSSVVLYAEALHLHDRYRLSWYDALIVAAALQADCSILYSEDLQDGQQFGDLRVRNPFA
ncbi:MAG TPA: PIN domain-containing protein [Acidobacteriaceae bacterium]|jgi:predicted nucleic acid-binding protein|nr:PIN domain-containing protein [Acidobacteriaceae bacterium]